MFNRGLNSEFVAALNQAYKKQTWWKTMMDDPDLHLGIRYNYLNIYYAGNSLINLSYKNDQLLGKTHYKYLLDPYKNLYIQSSDGKANPNNINLQTLFIKDLHELKPIKRASLSYAGEEKKGIQKILMSNHNIIDVEIALTDEGAKEEVEGSPDVERKRSTAPRIDFAALQKRDKVWELLFFEAKLFSNSDIRASENKEPKIVQQIKTYNKLIEDQLPNIKESYIRVCKNLMDLEGKILTKKKAVVEEVAQKENLTISPRPRLIIFGFDRDQQKGRLAQDLERLKDFLKENPIYSKGDSYGFTSGIST